MNQDRLIHGMLVNRALRFAAIDGTELVRMAQKTHALSRVATAALGRQLLMTSLTASLCKNDTDTVTTVLAGNGPSGNLVCVGRTGGLVKGYATNPDAELPLRSDGKLDVRGYVGTSGKLTVIRDLGLKEPYVGMCNLISGEIAEDFAQYFWDALRRTPYYEQMLFRLTENVASAQVSEHEKKKSLRYWTVVFIRKIADIVFPLGSVRREKLRKFLGRE